MDKEIKYWWLTIKTGILKKKKMMISTPPDWKPSKVKEVLLEVHPDWKGMSLKQLKNPPKKFDVFD